MNNIITDIKQLLLKHKLIKLYSQFINQNNLCIDVRANIAVGEGGEESMELTIPKWTSGINLLQLLGIYKDVGLWEDIYVKLVKTKLPFYILFLV